MTDRNVEHYEASPERIDIMIHGIIGIPVLDENGVPTGETKKIVDYSPAGAEDMVRIQVPVELLMNVEAVDDPHSTVHNIAKGRAAQVSRALAHHNDTHEVPPGHTALEEWKGLTPAMCHALRQARVRSLEQLAEASEATKARMAGAMINPRKLSDDCKAYLAWRARNAGEAAQADVIEQNRNLKSELDDMKSKFAQLLVQLGVGDETEKPKRGRKANGAVDEAPSEVAA